MQMRPWDHILALAIVMAGGTLCAASLPARFVAITGPTTALPGMDGVRLSVLGAPQIDDQGRVLATCRVVGLGAVLYENDIVLLGVDSAGGARVLARTGESAPGAGIGRRFVSSFYPRLSFDGQAHAVGFVAGDGVTADNNTGVWSGPIDGALSGVLLSGQTPAPGVLGGVFGGFVSTYPGACSRAGMAMVAQLGPGPGGVDANNFVGLWGPTTSGPTVGDLGLLARLGVVDAPGSPPGLAGAGYALINSRSLVMSDNGRLALTVGLASGYGGVVPENDTAIFERRPDGSTALAAREGDAVPGVPGARFASLETSGIYASSLAGGGGGVSINSAGDMVFVDQDLSDPAAASAGASRLWRRSAAGAFALLAQRGLAAGDAPGVIDVIDAPAIDSRGRVAFSGVCVTADGQRVAGVFVVDPGSTTPRLIARSGVSGTALGPPGTQRDVFDDQPPPRGSVRLSRSGHVLVQWRVRPLVAGGGASGPVRGEAIPGLWAIDPGGASLAPGQPPVEIVCVVRQGDDVDVPGLGVRRVKSINTFIGPAGDDDGRTTNINRVGEVALTLRFADDSGAIGVFALPGLGACCEGVGCSVMIESVCAGAFKRFAGVGTVCGLSGGGGGAGACCPYDFDQSGQADFSDVIIFINAWFARSPAADVSGTGAFGIDDVLGFLRGWFAGC